MNNVSPIQTFYARRTNRNRSDHTVVYQIDYSNNRVNFAFAQCRGSDTFTRKEGRAQALPRLAENPISLSLSHTFKTDRYRDIEAGLRNILKLPARV